jgi:glyoxylase-like metal-dependent hydrolase (beta-lactamase superfamily II)
MGGPLLVAPGVYQLRALGARVTAITGGDGLVLVDAGGPGSAGFILRGLKVLGHAAADVRLVVATHCHPDHVGGLERLVEATSARVAAHRLEAPAIAGEVPVPTPYRSSLAARVTRPVMPLVYRGSTAVDHRLEDGDSLPGAPDVRVIHTPGHTPGSLCLYLNSRRVLIVGDALQYRFGRLRPPAPAVTWDLDQARESLKKLLDLDFEIIVFSHFSPLTTGGKQALLRLVQPAPS